LEWLLLWEEAQPKPTLRELVEQGYAPAEIAQRLGITRNAAKVARWRLLRRGL
jgi:hypothetical protein